MGGEISRSWLYSTGPTAYFMAKALPINNGVTEIVWYIVDNEGEIHVTWNTQTKTGRLQELLMKGKE
jgi:hypothetical protein